jgi:hypothetical protein
MNAKKCKAIRRMISRRDDLEDQTQWLRHKQTGTIICAPKTKRGFYRRLKRSVVRSVRAV